VPSGSGKSTTLAAMINYLNETESRRVITLEDPIEYVYTNNKCIITQRELGNGTLSFADALKHILCQALVPRLDGTGRTAAVEVMLANPAVKNIIREGRIHQLPNAIVTQTHSGMMLLDHALLNLHRSGIISSDSLFACCNDREEVAKLMGKANVAEQKY